MLNVWEGEITKMLMKCERGVLLAVFIKHHGILPAPPTPLQTFYSTCAVGYELMRWLGISAFATVFLLRQELIPSFHSFFPSSTHLPLFWALVALSPTAGVS